MSSISDLATALAAVGSVACEEYRSCAPLLVAHANQQMADRADIGDLLGPCPLAVLFRNHADHANFMAAQLELKSADALVAMLAWVYQTHQLRGVSLGAFPIDMEIWRAGVKRHLGPSAAAQVGAVYRQLGELHGVLLQMALTPQSLPETDDELRPHIQRYLQALLAPDMRAALRAAAAYIQHPDQIAIWWEQVVQPTMYEIGRLWAQGEISVGQEHMATAITQRVMAHYYPQILDMPRRKGHVVVISSPGELHEIGARILADLLEMNGWDVYYTGASTPADGLVDLLAQTRARCLCISTTLLESLPAVTALIAQVRSAGLSPAPQILVGGQAYQSDPNIWRQVGADSCAHSAREGVQYINAAFQ